MVMWTRMSVPLLIRFDLLRFTFVVPICLCMSGAQFKKSVTGIGFSDIDFIDRQFNLRFI